MSESVSIDDWSAFTDAFDRFFSGAGTVEIGADSVSFTSVHPITGLVELGDPTREAPPEWALANEVDVESESEL